jgi:superfamily II DNA or RNA helicase
MAVVRSTYQLSTCNITDEESSRLKTRLTLDIIDTFRNDSNAKFYAYHESGGFLHLPRFFGVSECGAAEHDGTSRGVDMASHAFFRGTLRDVQLEAANTVLATLRDDTAPFPRGGMLVLGCGMGKTITALYIAMKLRKRTMVLCNRSFLLEQWKERIAQFIPNASIGLVKQDTVDVERDIILASLHSVAMRAYDATTFDNIGLIIVDEAHHLSAPVFSQALQKLPASFVLSLSATPARRDGLEPFLYWSMGPVLFRASDDESSTRRAVKVEIITDATPRRELVDATGRPMFARMLNGICNDKKRTELAASHLIAHLSNGRRALVLSDRLLQLDAFAALLHDARITYGHYVGKSTPKERADAALAQCILSTYSMAREALDLPFLDTLLMASPIGDVEQAVGRVLREHPDKQHPLIIDICDMSIGVFRSMHFKRLRFYRRGGFAVAG